MIERRNKEVALATGSQPRSDKRLEYTIVMLLLGIIISGVFSFVNFNNARLAAFGNGLGLAFIVSGLVLLYQEIMNVWVGTPDEKRFDEVLNRLHRPDLRKIVDNRKDYTKYHEWTGIKDRTDIFFAGHSVLHRIKADFKLLPVRNAEDAFLRKLEDGSSIKILLLDPAWQYVEDIITVQAQRPNDFYRDLHVALGFVGDIAKALQKRSSLQGELEIKMCRSNLHYSFHRIKYVQSGEVDMLVGFYFAGILGTHSPLFRAETEDIQDYFESHFEKLFEAELTTQDLLIYTPSRKDFCEQTRKAYVAFLDAKIQELSPQSRNERLTGRSPESEETQNVRPLPPSEHLRIDHSDTWSEQDRRDLTAFSLQYAATLYPEEEEIV